MLTSETLNYILGIIALASVVFTIWNSVKKPQTETEEKAALLSQQVTLEREGNNQKFQDLGIRLDKAFELAQNHTHSVSVQVEGLAALVNNMNISMSKDITRLSTIIQERLPKK